MKECLTFVVSLLLTARAHDDTLTQSGSDGSCGRCRYAIASCSTATVLPSEGTHQVFTSSEHTSSLSLEDDCGIVELPCPNSAGLQFFNAHLYKVAQTKHRWVYRLGHSTVACALLMPGVSVSLTNILTNILTN